jgi:hypothetical protein
MKADRNLGAAGEIALISLFLLVNILMLSSCGSSKGVVVREEEGVGKILAKSIIFQCDKQINQGMLLPVDVIYITRYHRPREVIAIGPNNWFNSSERQKWETRQTLSLKGGETRTLELNQLWLRETKLLVIFADFKDVEEPDPQQVLIDRSGKHKEKILVMPQQMMLDKKFSSWIF